MNTPPAPVISARAAPDVFVCTWRIDGSAVDAHCVAPGLIGALDVPDALAARLAPAARADFMVALADLRAGRAEVVALSHVLTSTRGETMVDTTLACLERAPTGAPRVLMATVHPAAPINEAWIASLLQASDTGGAVGIWYWDLDRRRVRWDRYTGTMFGDESPSEGIDSEILYRLIHPDDAQRYIAAVEAARTTGSLLAIDCRMRRRDAYTHLSLRGVATFRQTDGSAHMLGIALDTSRLRDAISAQEALTHRLRLATRAGGVGIWEYAFDSGDETWDEQMYALFGRYPGQETPDEILRRSTSAQSFERINELCQLARETGAYENTYEITWPTGEHRWIGVSAIGLADNSGGFRRLLGASRDITEHIQAERARIDNEALARRLQLAVQAGGIGTWEYVYATDVEVWDDQVYALYGCPDRDRTVDELWETAVSPESRDEANRKVALARETGSFECVYDLVLPDGQRRWLADRAIVVRDGHGPTRLVGVTWDMSERRRIEQAEQERAEAQRASLAKSEFLSRMSHELRTPLNAVLGFVQLIKANRRTTREQQAQWLDQIETAGWHLLELINEVLELSRIEAGELQVTLDDVDIVPLVHEAASYVQTQAQRRSITLSVNIAADAPRAARADELRLRQVLLNLASNAVKYNRDGGQVEFRVMRASDAEVAIRVRDTGRGLSSDQVRNLFEPFNRLGMERSGIEGTGIGLVIARRLTELMNGRLNVCSTLGEGSDFSITLAASSRAPAAAPAQTFDAQPDGDSAQGLVLYIEDNPTNQILVQEYLSLRPGVELVTVENGHLGVEAALRLKPDLILIDMHLPDMDGAQVFSALKPETSLRATRFVALTASAMRADREQALAAGFDDYWTKPLAMNVFLAGVDALLALIKPAPGP